MGGMSNLPYVLTLVADPDRTTLSDAVLARVRDVARAEAPIMLQPGEAADLFCAAPPPMDMVQEALAGLPVDAVVQQAAGRRKRLLIADMDSTVVQGETLDELAALAGVGEQVAAITRRSMNGELDFAQALRERVAMLEGQSTALLELCWKGVVLTSGAAELVQAMKAQGAVTALVSGGFTFFTERVAATCGFSLHRANVLEHADGRLTGRVAEPILDRDAKLRTLLALCTEHAIPIGQTLAVGDGANDMAMIGAAGLGVAFHAKPMVAAMAPARIQYAGLRALRFLQGI
jgi:phosphoserine phosphatase